MWTSSCGVMGADSDVKAFTAGREEGERGGEAGGEDDKSVAKPRRRWFCCEMKGGMRRSAECVARCNKKL